MVGAWTLGFAQPLEAQTPSGAQDEAGCPAGIVKSLAGSWRAPQYKMRRSSEVGVAVFGENAFDIRDVELTLQASGAGVLKITTSVLDEKGRTQAPAQVEAQLTVGPSATATAGRCEPEVTVTGAEERYLDATKFTAPLAGADARLLVGPKAGEVELRFQTPQGAGSFWTTLRRQGR
jgi:hypothetical protein